MRSEWIVAALLILRCGVAANEASCEKGALGVEPGLRRGEGVEIVNVVALGPADMAGIRQGDVLLEVGQRKIQYACEAPALLFHRDCAPVRVVVEREGTRIEKTITPADQIPLYDKSCADGNPSACYRRATFTNDARLYEQACERGSPDACAAHGYLLMTAGKAEAVKILDSACNRGSGAACAHLAYLYAEGKIVAKDEVRALDLYTRGCNAGDTRGCYSKGVLHDQGRGAAMSATTAAPAYQMACDGGVSMACTDLGYLYERGKGVMKDLTRAADLFRRGCEGSPCEPPNLLGCVNLGDAYRDGIGVAKDPAHAAEIFRSTCEMTVDDPSDEKHRIHACVLLGALELNGLGVPPAVERGLARSLDGCNRGAAYGCFNVAALAAPREDYPRAAGFYGKACDGGDAESCFELSQLYDEAKGVPFDYDRAAALRAKACKAGFEKACR
jgi:TPR repeat protein